MLRCPIVSWWFINLYCSSLWLVVWFPVYQLTFKINPTPGYNIFLLHRMPPSRRDQIPPKDPMKILPTPMILPYLPGQKAGWVDNDRMNPGYIKRVFSVGLTTQYSRTPYDSYKSY